MSVGGAEVSTGRRSRLLEGLGEGLTTTGLLVQEPVARWARALKADRSATRRKREDVTYRISSVPKKGAWAGKGGKGASDGRGEQR